MSGWGRCRRCGQQIWWGTSPYAAGKAFPFDDPDEQQSHFATCAAQAWVTDSHGVRHQGNACKACGKAVWWDTTPRGKRRPMDVDGDVASWECHFDTCAGARSDSEEFDAAWASARQRRAAEPESVPYAAAAWLPDLGLSWPVTLGDVKNAFRRLARTKHPDMGGSASEFIRIKLAYDRLRELMGEEVGV